MSPATAPPPGDGGARIAVVGLHGGHVFGPGAVEAIAGADVVVGSSRQLHSTASLRAPEADSVVLAGPMDAVLTRVTQAAQAG
ncbi:MAG: hypothetical protein ACYCU6_03120, partial [Acidimicrobiales bacterium]